jgi:hypothetical protein
MALKNSIKRSEKPAERLDSKDLDLPDWSGMDDSSSRISPEAAFRLSEEYRQWLPEWADDRLRPEKCIVEFVL